MSVHLLIETSGRGGFVALVRDDAVIQTAELDDTRRHARDLAEKARHLFAAESLAPKDTAGVVVGLGPGSYTGLRVGLASAKAFAFAVGCPLVAVPTFHAIANRCGADRVHVIADALQGFIYAQQFHAGRPAIELAILNAETWAATLNEMDSITGPGVAVHEAKIPAGIRRMEMKLRTVKPESLWTASKEFAPLTREEMFRVEPLYLRGSSAEEKRKAQSVSAAIASARVS